ncbi:MAG: type II toxin-antitoxin system HicB family antitoxin [Desulfovibrionaceae bacterium]|nr:type II toxin-antitoxin system HicB family antitoxin [Desulfovibrionaceae bacterium]MBF0513089.1 type II toxin-antitoxin system HicB family antitoxin [Desulfovibrionaceae bacterium]
MNISSPVTLEPQAGGGFFARFPDLLDAFSEGDTEEETLFNAAEALTGILALKLEDDDAIPLPSAGVAGAHYIAPEAKVQAALLVRFTRGERSLAELARALKTSWPSAKRLEDPTHWPSLKTLDKAATAMGKKLVLGFE